MTLTGKVIGLEDGSEYVDKTDRITIRFTDVQYGQKFTVRNTGGYEVGDELLIEVRLNTDAVHTSPLAASPRELDMAEQAAGEVSRG